MKNKRHEEILNIIENNDVETQEELCQLLEDAGYSVTQATVSRDIKQLNLIKYKGRSGRQKYVQERNTDTVISDKLVRVLSDSIVSMEEAGNILVIKTSSGMAMAAAASIDALKINGIVGCIAGDDTIMCAVKDTKQMKFVMDSIASIGGICY